MPAIKFRFSEYDSVSGIKYTNIAPNILGFFGDREDLSIKANTYSDIANIIDAISLKRVFSDSNIKRTTNESGLVFSDLIKNQELSINNIPNWLSTININFGDTSSATAFDVTSAKVTASGAGILHPVIKESESSGVIQIHLFEMCHTNPNSSLAGSGSTSWSYLEHQTKSSNFSLTRNPGPSGYYAAIGSTGVPSKEHDWHIGMCVKPTNINIAPFMSFTCIIEYI